MTKGTVYVDGATLRENPGIGGAGVVLTINGEKFTLAEKLGYVSNNVAEYQALIKGLILAIDHNVDFLVVYSDSKLIVNQMNGRWKVKHKDMKKLHDRAAALARNLKGVEYKWIPREQNTEADELSKIAVGSRKPSAEPVEDKKVVVEIVNNSGKILVKEKKGKDGEKVIIITCLGETDHEG